jgi:CDP-diacylglycerol---serine O-phosphatidyltransferase
VFAGAVFDVFDGLAARAFGGGSEFGKQLDSLADMVTFGVAPGMLIWFSAGYSQDAGWGFALPAAVLVMPVASAWRLAKFNLDTRQSMGFLGLPTPSNGLFWTSVVMTHLGVAQVDGPGSGPLRVVMSLLLTQPLLTLLLALVLAAFMLSELPLPGLKFKHLHWNGNQVVLTLVAMGAVLVLLYGIAAVPLVLTLYLLSPLWGRAFGVHT